MSDPIHNPAHYTAYPVQPIEICRHLGFCLGNVVKYVLRAPLKGGLEDLNKALKYLKWEEEMPGQDVAFWRGLLINAAIDELAEHLGGQGNDNSHDDDITIIQAEFLSSLKIYIEDTDLGVGAMRADIHDLAKAIASKRLEAQAQP